MSGRDDDDDYAVGKGRPPKWTRWSDKSGNPNGRPKKLHSDLPYEEVLGTKVPVTENGSSKMMRSDEAFLLFLTGEAASNNGAIARRLLRFLERIKALDSPVRKSLEFVFCTYDDLGQIDTSMVQLGMLKRHDQCRSTARLFLESWIVQAALNGLGARKFTEAEQHTVYASTREPHKVHWPDWWTSYPA
ncbi:MAG: DUF5681 domain-containing protein [Pseudomonadota bacterium]